MSTKKNKKSLSIHTLSAMHCVPKHHFDAHALSIHPTSSFDMATLKDSIDLFNGSRSGFTYSRYDNPTVSAVAEKLAIIESGKQQNDLICLMTSSGMSAIASTCLSVLKSGDTLVTHDGLYGGTTELLQDLARSSNIQLVSTDLNDLESLSKIQKSQPITAIFIETPSNPLLQCVAMQPLALFAKENGIVTICDNSISTPYLQRPLDLGIDITIYSTTKFLSGHGNTISGAIVLFKSSQYVDKIRKIIHIYGTNCSPFEAWLVDMGIKTLGLRMERQCSNANTIAQFLNKHPKVNRVYHTSLDDHNGHPIAMQQMTDHSPLMSFEVKGGLDSAKKIINGFEIITHAPTLGDLNSLVLHPDTSSHRNLDPAIKKRIGITPGLIRLSVGIEAEDDLLTEFERLFDKI